MACCIFGALLFIGLSSVMTAFRDGLAGFLGKQKSSGRAASEWSLHKGYEQ